MSKRPFYTYIREANTTICELNHLSNFKRNNQLFRQLKIKNRDINIGVGAPNCNILIYYDSITVAGYRSRYGRKACILRCLCHGLLIFGRVISNRSSQYHDGDQCFLCWGWWHAGSLYCCTGECQIYQIHTPCIDHSAVYN